MSYAYREPFDVLRHGWKYRMAISISKKLYQLKALDRCFVRVPIFYEDRTMFVDPITRQTFPIANEIKSFIEILLGAKFNL